MMRETVMRSANVFIFVSIALAMTFATAVQAKPYHSGQVTAFKPREQLCLRQDCPNAGQVAEMLRGGSTTAGEDEDEEVEADSEKDIEVEEEDDDDEEEDAYDTEDEEAESDVEYEDEAYDDDEYDEEEDTQVSGTSDKGEYVDPYFVSPQIQLYAVFGSMMLTKRIDMFNPWVVKLIRFLFIAQLVLQQLFIVYVRIMAKKNNDRTPLKIQNPLSGMLEKQMGQSEGTNDMVKGLASSFLSSETTVMEYDMKKATSMQGTVLFNMAFNYFLHFRMEKVQPLLMQIVTGTMQLIYNPLFQVYVMGRNLERPFKTQLSAAQKMKGDQTGEKQSQDETEADDTTQADDDEDEAEEEDDDETEDEEDEEDDDDAVEAEADDEEPEEAADDDETTEEEGEEEKES